jgi:hypothetical protein
MDDCSAATVVMTSDVTEPGECAGSYVRIVGYQTSDACGNVNTTTRFVTVAVTDADAPVWESEDLELDADCADDIDLLISLNTPTATDNCSISFVTIVSDEVSGECSGTYLRTVGYQAFDGCGNVNPATRFISLTISDDQAPSISCPATQTGNFNTACQYLVPDFTGLVTAEDNCDPNLVLAQSPAVGTIVEGGDGIETLTINITAMDCSGNMMSCGFVVVLTDVILPVAQCQNITIGLDENGEAVIAPEQINNGSTDNCGIASMVLDVTTFDCNDVGLDLAEELFISEYIEGASNNKAIEIFNGTPNAINLASGLYAIEFYFNGSVSASLTIPLTGTVSAGDVYVIAHALANATILAQTDQTSGAGWYNGDDAIVLIKNGVAIDVLGQIGFDPGTEWGTGLTSTADNTLRRKAPVSHGDENGLNVFDPAIEWDGYATDNADNLGSHVHIPGPKQIPVVLSVTDANGNSATCAAHVIVWDFLPPVLLCPDDVTVNCEDSYVPDPFGAPGVATTSDNCDPDPALTYTDLIESNGCPGNRLVSRIWTATDFHGNSTTCMQFITIQDVAPPYWLTDPGNLDIVLACDDVEGLQIAQAVQPAAADNCDIDVSDVVKVAGAFAPATNCPQSGTYTNTWTVTDQCGNVSTIFTQVIVLQDHEPPQIICAADVTIECGDELPAESAEVLDACDPNASIINVTYSDPDADCAQTLVRTYFAADACGNISSCTQRIYILDTTGPMILCSDQELGCDARNCLAFDDEVVDPFAPPLIISTFNIGGISVQVQAWEKGGAQVEAALFNTQTPHPNDLDLGAPNSLYGGPGVNSLDPAGFNNSNNRPTTKAMIVQTPDAPVADDSDESDSLVFLFDPPVFILGLIAIDFELAQINSGAGVYAYDSQGGSLGFVGFNAMLGEDNSLEEVVLNTAGVGKLVVYYGAAAPSAGAIAGLCFMDIPAPEVTDCHETVLTYTETAVQIDGCSTELSRAYTAEDACGNVTGCTELIAIQTDFHQPDMICPEDLTIACGDPLPPPAPEQVVVTDNCGLMGEISVSWIGDFIDSTGCAEVVRRSSRTARSTRNG